MVVVLGGVGQLAGTVYAALGLGILNKFIEGWAGAVLAKIAVLVLIVVFIQKRPQGCSRSRAGARKHERTLPTGGLGTLPAGGGQGGGTPGTTSRSGCPHPNLSPRGEGRTCCPGASRCSPRTGWTAFLVALIVVCAVAPVLNLVVPADSAFHMSDYAVALVGKIMCYAICALAMDLIWGYTGILSLGHGLFFALGGYAMGMYLMRQIGRDGNYQSDLPDFMVFLDWKALPWHWTFSDSFVATCS
jgi:ABC-type branched-subunit amino acid transport system permease subunit